MQGTIIQTLGIALALNARLRGVEISKFWPDGSIFAFCHTVRFIDPGRRGWFGRPATVVAPDPAQWLDTLDRDVRGARVFPAARCDPQISAPMTVGFVGGGSRWLIEIVGRRRSEFWEAGWSVGDSEAADRRIWNVDYVRLSPNASTAPVASGDLTACKAEVAEILEGISRFASEHDLGFVEMFAEARRRLDETDPLRGLHHADMAPAGLMSLEARQLLAASQSGWVFGGMGSWNDAYVEGEAGKAYDAWTARLFNALQKAAALAVNSSFADAGRAAPN